MLRPNKEILPIFLPAHETPTRTVKDIFSTALVAGETNMYCGTCGAVSEADKCLRCGCEYQRLVIDSGLDDRNRVSLVHELNKRFPELKTVGFGSGYARSRECFLTYLAL